MIALSLLHPDKPVVGVMGDGGFGMMVQELETAARLGIKPLFVVFCDQSLSLIRIPQAMRGYESKGIDFGPVDWPKVAEGFGVEGHWAESVMELERHLSDWSTNRRAMVLTVKIDEDLYRGNSY